VVDGEGVYLVCEHGIAVLARPLARRLLPMLDGRPLGDVLAALADDYPTDTVLRAIDTLREAGHVIDADPSVPVGLAGYWDSAGLHGDLAVSATAAPVRLHVLGRIDGARAAAALTSAGLRISQGTDQGADGEEPALHLVLTDDYLSAELDELGADLRHGGHPWLLAKPAGVRPAVGPVFEPDGTCYTCLAERLRGQRQAEVYLDERAAGGRVRPPLVETPASRAFTFGAVASTATQWLAGHSEAGPVLRVLDTLALTIETHAVSRRPHCARCGDPRLGTRRMAGPVSLSPQAKEFTADGGHRSRSPEAMLATWGHLVDPVTGVVPALTPLSSRLPFVRGYTAGSNRALRMTSLRGLRDGLRTHSSGKGMTDVQARASALGEALERHSGVFAGDEPRITASYASLGADALHPNASQLFSDSQFANRAAWNAPGIAYQMVCEPLDPHAMLEWTPVWSLTERRHKHVPTSMLFFDYPQRGRCFALADSNGNAAGTSLEDAVLQGFYELVERDGVGIWWYNRLRRRAIDLDAMADPWVDELRREYAALHREVWVLDLTTDLGIPVVAAVSRRTYKPAQDILFAFGAHDDARLAVQRALAELNQFLPAVAFSTAAGDGYQLSDPQLTDWWQRATISGHPYLLPDPALPPGRVEDLGRRVPDDLAEHVDQCRALVESAGMEMLVLDMTRPDIGLPVAKVIVPGLRHFWTRFGPGRLYDEPVRAGLRESPIGEADLNPIPMFV
jgi:ribosomal protein S12 methylthiotransferase accessory factor